MAPRMAAFTVSGASKLTSPWSRRNGSLTLYIMSRMRMMPENGTVSRNWPIRRMLAAVGCRLPVVGYGWSDLGGRMSGGRSHGRASRMAFAALELAGIHIIADASRRDQPRSDRPDNWRPTTDNRQPTTDNR